MPFSPQNLLRFLKSKLYYHPNFTQFNFHILNWAATIDSFHHDHSTFEWMARTLAITDQFFELWSLLEFLVFSPCPCSDGTFSCSRTEPIFKFAINAYCRAGKLDDVVVAFDSMRKLIDGKPSVVLYKILINGFLKFARNDQAFELYNRMIRDRVKPDVFTFNILLSSYCRNSQYGLALDLFKEMKEKGVSPNVISFNTLIKIHKFHKAKKKGLGRVGSEEMGRGEGRRKKKRKKKGKRKKKVKIQG
ncbi:hypothetical protein UlMin_017527 [Ulmus minor]